MMKLFKVSLGILAIGLFLTSCSKYDEGPGLSLYSKGKRVQGTWYFSRVTYNDIDSTEAYLQRAIEFMLGEGSDKDWGVFTLNSGVYSQVFDPNRLKFGGWKFIADKDSFQMIIISERVEDYDTTQWKINRLAYDEWWMERHIDDSTRVIWQLWKMVH
ncbi:MAG: hypothetical protein U9N86_17465 [Bacteroidota bacterium]|nr:hypothetical protein [Bacteroidota bacterium]